METQEELDAAVEQALRVEDRQLDSLAAFDQRTQTLMTLALAAVGGGFAISVYLIEGVCGWGRILMLLSCVGILLAFISSAFFVHAYVGLWRSSIYSVTPDPEALAHNVAKRPFREHQLQMIQGVRKAFGENDAMIRKAAPLRQKGVWVLLVSVGAYSVAGVGYVSLRLLSIGC